MHRERPISASMHLPALVWLLLHHVSQAQELVPLMTIGGMSNKPPLVMVHYTNDVLVSKTTFMAKIQELLVMRGVQNVSNSRCPGAVMLSCDSHEIQKRVISDLAVDPLVEAAIHAASEQHCNRQVRSGTKNVSVIEVPNISDMAEAFAPKLQQLLQFNGSMRWTGSLPMDADGERWDLLPAEEIVASKGNHTSTEVQAIPWSLSITNMDAAITTSVLRAGVERAISSCIGGSQGVAAHIKNVRKLVGQQRSGKLQGGQHHHQVYPTGLRKQIFSATIDFEIRLPQGANQTLAQHARNQLKLLSAGGRAAERFDAALDHELGVLGAVLPDSARSRFHETVHYHQELDEDASSTSKDVLLMMIVLIALSAVVFTTLMVSFLVPFS